MAEPSDLKIVCGEFDSGVEIIRNSVELEQVFNIKRIVNHPNYQPNRVQQRLNINIHILYEMVINRMALVKEDPLRAMISLCIMWRQLSNWGWRSMVPWDYSQQGITSGLSVCPRMMMSSPLTEG